MKYNYRININVLPLVADGIGALGLVFRFLSHSLSSSAVALPERNFSFFIFHIYKKIGIHLLLPVDDRESIPS